MTGPPDDNQRARVVRTRRTTEGNPPRSRTFGLRPVSFQNLAVCLLSLDSAGRVLYASRGAEKLLGSRSVKGVPIRRLFPSLDLRDLAQNARPACAGRLADRSRFPLTKKRPRGKNEITAQCRSPRPPTRLWHVLVVVDKSDLDAARMTAILRKESRRLAAIVKEADDAILSVGADLKITLFNRGAEKIFGYSAAEILGQPLNLLIPDRFHERHERRVEQFATASEGARYMGERSEVIGRRKNGEEFPAEASILKLEIDGERTFAAILRDVTARKREDEALQLAKKQAEAASLAKSRFLANMSHELRTPLNAIIGFSQLMLEHVYGPMGHPNYEGYVVSILEGGEILLSVINDILDMSKIEAGKTELNLTELMVEDTIASTVRVLGERAVMARLRLSTNVERGLPALRADERMVKQILLNLVSNAIKFTPERGEIVIAARIEPDGSLALTVRDTGIGMAAKDVPKALEPFGQINGTLARRYPGTGLGLPLVKSIIELHGGTLTIDSREKLGTIATVHFPAVLVVRRKAPAASCPKGDSHACAETGTQVPQKSYAIDRRNIAASSSNGRIVRKRP